ncbi:MAG: beta-lactamase family protein [Verrucomicrobiae bacterium]|nr:beta-lactamase family protein [Verrucomicrobiae bacterium]
MKRRQFLLSTGGLIAFGTDPLFAAWKTDGLDGAAAILKTATDSEQIRAASLHVRQGDKVFSQVFGAVPSPDSPFLLASISKTISAAAVMKVHEEGKFALDDPAVRYLPEFTGEGRETITIRQLLTHISGLPDQLPENAELRARHAPLSEFVKAATRTPLLFPAGKKYSYSSMAILLATEIAQRLSGKPFSTLVDETIYRPLGMKHSAMGVGNLDPASLILNQVEFGAPESGAGDPSTKSWDWNSAYWRNLGAPWGGAHGSAPDVARFLGEFLHPDGKALKPETARLMIRNHNPEGLRPRGLGFDLGPELGVGPGCSEHTFGHTGSTGTRCWADPKSDTICVILTTLPARAVDPHPRDLASRLVTEAVNG